jgi:hypothetical protein
VYDASLLLACVCSLGKHLCGYYCFDPIKSGKGKLLLLGRTLGHETTRLARDALGTRFRVINPAFKAPRRRNGVRHTPWVGRSAGTRLVTFGCWAVLRVNCYLWAACWSCAISGAGCSRLSRTSPICDEPRPTKRTSELRIRCATAPKFPPQTAAASFAPGQHGSTMRRDLLFCTFR